MIIWWPKTIISSLKEKTKATKKPGKGCYGPFQNTMPQISWIQDNVSRPSKKTSKRFMELEFFAQLGRICVALLHDADIRSTTFIIKTRFLFVIHYFTSTSWTVAPHPQRTDRKNFLIWFWFWCPIWNLYRNWLLYFHLYVVMFFLALMQQKRFFFFIQLIIFVLFSVFWHPIDNHTVILEYFNIKE